MAKSGSIHRQLSKSQSKFSLEAYARYLAAERRAKIPDLFVLKALYERAISEAAKRRFIGEIGAEEMLRLFWVGYCDTLVRSTILFCFLSMLNVFRGCMAR